jgi:hypothetical protein
MYINFAENGLGSILGDFSQTHLVTLIETDGSFFGVRVTAIFDRFSSLLCGYIF